MGVEACEPDDVRRSVFLKIKCLVSSRLLPCSCRAWISLITAMIVGSDVVETSRGEVRVVVC